MDPETLRMLLMMGPEAMGAANYAPQPVPPAPIQTAPPVVPPVPTPTSVMGPAAPMVAPQSFEPTNTGNPMMMGPSEAYRSEPMGAPTSLGAALEPAPAGVPIPRPRPPEAPTAAAAPAAAGGTDALLKSLRGVQMPAPPTPQKVSTPHAPAVAKMSQQSGLIDLLASLGIGPQQALPGLKLPSTLGQALGGR